MGSCKIRKMEILERETCKIDGCVRSDMYKRGYSLDKGMCWRHVRGMRKTYCSLRMLKDKAALIREGIQKGVYWRGKM